MNLDVYRRILAGESLTAFFLRARCALTAGRGALPQRQVTTTWPASPMPSLLRRRLHRQGPHGRRRFDCASPGILSRCRSGFARKPRRAASKNISSPTTPLSRTERFLEPRPRLRRNSATRAGRRFRHRLRAFGVPGHDVWVANPNAALADQPWKRCPRKRCAWSTASRAGGGTHHGTLPRKQARA